MMRFSVSCYMLCCFWQLQTVFALALVLSTQTEKLMTHPTFKQQEYCPKQRTFWPTTLVALSICWMTPYILLYHFFEKKRGDRRSLMTGIKQRSRWGAVRVSQGVTLWEIYAPIRPVPWPAMTATGSLGRGGWMQVQQVQQWFVVRTEIATHLSLEFWNYNGIATEVSK